MFNLRKPPPAITSHQFDLDGQNIEFRLIQSHLARSVRFKIGIQSGLEIVVPRRFNFSRLPRIIHEHEDWILKQMDKMEERKKLLAKNRLRDGSVITILGVPKTVRCLPTRKNKPYVKEARKLKYTADSAYYEGFELMVFSDGTAKQINLALEKHLRTAAEKYFQKRTHELSARMDTPYQRITIRGQKSRWGSCSRDKNLNFNWRLVFLPPEVIDSIIIHELAHTVHMNHSKAFHALVVKFCPDYKELNKHLKHPQFPL